MPNVSRGISPDRTRGFRQILRDEEDFCEAWDLIHLLSFNLTSGRDRSSGKKWIRHSTGWASSMPLVLHIRITKTYN